jgi:hypothetical protein
VIESQFCVLTLPITYIDKELWGPPDDTLKQKILNDAKKNNNKVIVVYDAATGEKNIIHEDTPIKTQANLYYELGVAQALGKETVIIKTPRAEMPSDFNRPSIGL